MRGLSVVDLDEKSGGIEINLDRFAKVQARDVTVMARQLATMISSGLSLLRALYILEDQSSNKKLKETIVAIRGDVEVGTSLSVAMAKHPKVFNGMPMLVKPVRIDVLIATLKDVLRRQR